MVEEQREVVEERKGECLTVYKTGANRNLKLHRTFIGVPLKLLCWFQQVLSANKKRCFGWEGDCMFLVII